MSKTYEVDPNNQKLLDAKEEGNETLNEVSSAYNTAIEANNNAKDKALGEIGKMEANGEWTKNTAIGNLIDSQNEQTDFAIEQIGQQKDQAHQDYIKEQSASYADYQKQTAQHGVNAEKMAAQGLQNTGYAESSMVAMYNQHQARLTAAREVYQKIALDLDNQMTNAKLQNNATIAQIAYNGTQQRLEMLMQYTMYGNQLLTEMATAKANVKNQNFQNYMSVYNQLLEENKYKTSVDQYNETLAFQREQFNWQKEQAEAKASSSGGSSSITKSGVKPSNSSEKATGSISKDVKNINNSNKTSKTSYKDAELYINELIKSGASKDRVSAEITLALREGALTKEQAKKLRATYTPRGLQYGL